MIGGAEKLISKKGDLSIIIQMKRWESKKIPLFMAAGSGSCPLLIDNPFQNGYNEKGKTHTRRKVV